MSPINNKAFYEGSGVAHWSKQRRILSAISVKAVYPLGESGICPYLGGLARYQCLSTQRPSISRSQAAVVVTW